MDKEESFVHDLSSNGFLMMQDELENLKFTSEDYDVPQTLYCDEGNIEEDESPCEANIVESEIYRPEEPTPAADEVKMVKFSHSP